MHEQSVFNPVTITSTVLGTLAGLYNLMNAGTIFQSVLLTAITTAVSYIVTFCIQQWLKKPKQ